MATYNDLMKKRALELQSQWQSKTQISNTLNVEKNLWYFNTPTTPTTPTNKSTPTPKPATPTPTPTNQASTLPWNVNTKTPTAPKTTAPGTSRVKQLAERNRANQIEFAKQNEANKPTPTVPMPEPAVIKPPTSLDWINANNSAMVAWNVWMQMIQEQGAKKQSEIMQQYNDDIATIRLEEDQTKSQYKNADQVLAWIRAVEDAYKRGITDPSQIASQTGIPLAQVQQVLRWEAFKALEFQDRATEDQRKEQEMKMSQLQTQTGRAVTDLEKNAERSKYSYEQQIEDMKRQAWLSEASMTKMWALTWGIQSSGYRMAIDMISQETVRWLDRLKKTQEREQDDIVSSRTRLLEDLETNTKSIKHYFDTWMTALRQNWLAQIQQINAKYGVASNNTVKALQQLYNDMEWQKVELLNQTMWLQKSFNDLWIQEIDYIEKRSTEWTWDRNKDIQTYLDLYKTNPALANSMFPELAWQVNNANFGNFDQSMDFTSIPWFAEKYPNQARAKNNNPGWIKTPSAQLAQARRDAWIQFTPGTASPSNEWWTPYTKFATIGDGLKAQWIALSRQWGDINTRLQKRVWTAEWPRYAQQVMSRAWIPQWITFQQLTAEQQQSLQMAVIRKESWWLYNLMTQGWAWWTPGWAWATYDENKAPLYNEYFTKNKLPVGMKMWTPQAEQFIAEAGVYKKEVDQKMKPFAQELSWMIRDLEKIDYSDFRALRAWLPGTWQNLRAKFDRILSSTALQELINLKSQWATFGALSNQELEFITNASTNLRLRGTYEQFKKDLDKMASNLEKWAGWTGTPNVWNTQQEWSPKASWFKLP